MRAATLRTLMRGSLLVVAVASVTEARADVTFVVDTLVDRIDADGSDGLCETSAGDCSLRAAIMQANRFTAAGVTRIELAAATYVLTRPATGANGDDNGDLDLPTPLAPSQRVEIVGAGEARTIIDANGIDRVIEIGRFRVVAMSGLTIRRGARRPGVGGGIANNGELTLTRCIVERNTAEYGGGIASNRSARLTVVDSTVRLNVASEQGGGLDLVENVDIRNSTIHSNTAGSDGGGLSTKQGVMTMVSSTVSGNVADGNGGGINNYARLALYNSSVIDNDADHDRDEDGGIGGGVVNGNVLVVRNSLIARNTLRDSPIYNDCIGMLEAYGRNFFYDLAGCNIPNPGSRIVGIDTIGPLADNGGPTATHALLSGNEAIGDASICMDQTGVELATDQRGAPRVVGMSCDGGAFEFDAVVPVAGAIFADDFEDGRR